MTKKKKKKDAKSSSLSRSNLEKNGGAGLRRGTAPELKHRFKVNGLPAGMSAPPSMADIQEQKLVVSPPPPPPLEVGKGDSSTVGVTPDSQSGSSRREIEGNSDSGQSSCRQSLDGSSVSPRFSGCDSEA